MAKRCDVCGKGPQVGNSVSHSKVHTKRRWMPNLQKVRALVAGKPTRVQACAKCLKAGKVVRAA